MSFTHEHFKHHVKFCMLLSQQFILLIFLNLLWSWFDPFFSYMSLKPIFLSRLIIIISPSPCDETKFNFFALFTVYSTNILFDSRALVESMASKAKKSTNAHTNMQLLIFERYLFVYKISDISWIWVSATMSKKIKNSKRKYCERNDIADEEWQPTWAEKVGIVWLYYHLRCAHNQQSHFFPSAWFLFVRGQLKLTMAERRRRRWQRQYIIIY